MHNREDSLSVQHIGVFNIFCLSLCSVLAILGIVIGDEFDYVIGVLTLLATVSTGFSFAVPWTIFAVMGAQIATFFFLGIGEIVHLTFIMIKVQASMPLFVLTGIRIVSYFLSGVVGVSYLRALIDGSNNYTAMIKTSATKGKGASNYYI